MCMTVEIVLSGLDRTQMRCLCDRVDATDEFKISRQEGGRSYVDLAEIQKGHPVEAGYHISAGLISGGNAMLLNTDKALFGGAHISLKKLYLATYGEKQVAPDA